MKYFRDSKDLKNKIYSENEIFNIPYEIELYKDKNLNKYFSKTSLNFIKLKIENEHKFDEEIKTGKINLLLNNSKSFISYKKNKSLIEFSLFDKLEDSNFFYNGMFNLNPFYSSFNGNTQNLNLENLFISNSFLSQLLKTEILNNKNIEFDLNINAEKFYNNFNFLNIKLNSKIKEGLIDFDNTEFQWKNFADFKLVNSLIFVKNGELFLDGKLDVSITNRDELYKYLLTPKKYRIPIKKIDFNFSYNFDQKIMSLSDIKIDDKYNQKINKEINNIILKDNNFHNKIYLKNFLNDSLKSYSG